MVLNITPVILAVIVLPFFIFQTTVIIFLGMMKYRKVTNYNSAFFTLFLMVSTVDLLSAINNFFGLRLHTFEVFIPFYLDSPLLTTILYLGSAYELYTQCFMHFAIAINRFWAVLRATKRGKSRAEVWASKAIIILPFLAFIPLSPRFAYQAVFVQGSNGAISPKYMDAWISTYQSTTAFLIIVSMALATFILQSVTVFYYRNLLSKKGLPSSQIKQDIRLLGQALIVLVVEVMLCGVQIIIYISIQQGNSALRTAAISQYAWISDLFNHTGAPALLIVSQKIRNDYLQFLGFKLKTPVIILAAASAVSINRK